MLVCVMPWLAFISSTRQTTNSKMYSGFFQDLPEPSTWNKEPQAGVQGWRGQAQGPSRGFRCQWKGFCRYWDWQWNELSEPSAQKWGPRKHCKPGRISIEGRAKGRMWNLLSKEEHKNLQVQTQENRQEQEHLYLLLMPAEGMAGFQGHLANTTVLPSQEALMSIRPEVDRALRDWGAGHKMLTGFTLTLLKQSNSAMESAARTTQSSRQCCFYSSSTHMTVWTYSQEISPNWLILWSVTSKSVSPKNQPEDLFQMGHDIKDIILRAFKIPFILRKWSLTDFKSS